MRAPVQVGEIIARKYEVLRILGRGGVGVVVKARHLKLLEPCALKLLRPELLETPRVRERFLREARACARLRGDHVVRVLDVDELDAETPYMVLEHLEGVDLGAYMKPGRPLPVEEAAAYVLQVCAALAEAHGLGIVHRDLEPANVFLARLADGTTRVKLLDFGSSRLLEDPSGADPCTTLDGALLGTPFFMAPEQACGEPADTRADIWAVGVLLYFLVTARLPFEGDKPNRIIGSVLMREPEPPSRHVPTLPAELDAIILRCLRKTPAQRPASVNEIAQAIAPFAGEGGASLESRTAESPTAESRPVESARAWSPPSQPGPPPPHPRWRMPAVIALSTGVAVGAWLALRALGPAPSRLDTKAAASASVSCREAP